MDTKTIFNYKFSFRMTPCSIFIKLKSFWLSLFFIQIFHTLLNIEGNKLKLYYSYC